MSQELIQKADLVLANLSSNGGVLTVEQSDRFIRTLQESPTILGAARTVPMNGPTAELNKIGFGSRILRAGVENTALTETQRSKPTTSKVPLATKEVIAEIRLPYGVLEDNIERGNLQDTVLALIAERAALDLEELVINGDTAYVNGADADDQAYLRLFDGLVKQLTTHEVDAATTGITPTTFSNAIKALPNKYRRNKPSLRFIGTPDIEQDYRLKVSERQTALGDATLTGAAAMQVQGVPIISAALMPTATAVLTNPQNIIIGIQRNFRLESERLISERQFKIVLTARVAFAIEEKDAAVKIVNFAD